MTAQEIAQAQLVGLRLLAGDPAYTTRSTVKVNHFGRYVVEFEVIQLDGAKPIEPPALKPKRRPDVPGFGYSPR